MFEIKNLDVLEIFNLEPQIVNLRVNIVDIREYAKSVS